MITRTLFRRNYFVFVSIIIVFIFMAFGSAFLVDYLDRPSPTQVRVLRPPNYVFRNLYQQLDNDPLVAFQKLQAASSATPDNFLRFDLVGANGKSLIDGSEVLPQALSAAELSALAQDKAVSFGQQDFGPPRFEVAKTRFAGVYFVHRFTPPPGFMKGMMMPPMPPPPGAPRMGPPRRNMVLLTVGFLIVSTLVSVAIALVYQFSRYRERSEDAFNVLNELRHGNLGARMPAKKFDELAPLVVAFNQMADDVQSMVESLRKADQARRQLLQDLAHDLRTPLASLKTFLETLQTSDRKLSDEKRQEVLTLCTYETDYFGHLVEDLLFLAQITEPKYSVGTEELNLLERVQDQITVFANRYPNVRFEVLASEEARVQTLMGSSKLIDRLLRNAFENSASFAKSKVRVELALLNKQLHVSITDDGPGFSAAALKEYGYKKASRILTDSSSGKRISVGIGSVIMKEILQIHGGDLKAENVSGQDQVSGGKVSFSLAVV